MEFIRSICMAILFVVLGWGANAYAVSSVTISPAAVEGVYVVYVAEVVDAAGIDFSVYYDASTMINPKVTSGPFASGAMMEANTSTAGLVRVVFITGDAFKGTAGQLATITFTKVGKLPGRLTDFKSSVYSTSSAQVAAQPIIGTSSQPFTNGEPTPTASGATNTSSSTSGGMSNIINEAQQASAAEIANIYSQVQQQQQQQSGSYMGSVTFSGDLQVQQNPRKEEPQREDTLKVESGNEVSPSTNPPAATASAPSIQPDNVKSQKAKGAKEALALLATVEMPVQRFRTFKGARTVKGFMPLFDTEAVRKAGVVQTPEIAVSDGKKKVSVKIELAASGLVPNFSLRGANLKTIRTITDKVWELDALPKKDKFDVRFSVLMGSEHADIPLTVIPTLAASVNKETLGLSEAGVNALLAKGETKGKLVYDLNVDGRQDFVDDYILVAHYLLKMQKQQKPAQKSK